MAEQEIKTENTKSLLGQCVGKLGDRSSSDVIVRLRTVDGKDDWLYCHSSILCEHSKYFAARLSDDWPTYHLLDSRNCIELFCSESDVDHHITLLRLLYAKEETLAEMWHNVKNALGILKVATKLGCDGMVDKCMQYLEAVPWEENEEEEILKTLPMLGSSMFPVLARIQPVDAEAVRNVFISAIRVATLPERKSSEALENFPSELKAAAQEQVEYMLVEDEDAPLLVADESVKIELKKCFSELFEGFKLELTALLPEVDWLKTEQARYPDLTEAFEVWCFRSKSAKRRFNADVSGAGTAPISSSS
ncbi:hypothetical protein Mapa_002668 [Marchantia paleacea]|nr:hypothetical protein Mapa_002668 [Marchantia paleacea]